MCQGLRRKQKKTNKKISLFPQSCKDLLNWMKVLLATCCLRTDREALISFQRYWLDSNNLKKFWRTTNTVFATVLCLCVFVWTLQRMARISLWRSRRSRRAKPERRSRSWCSRPPEPDWKPVLSPCGAHTHKRYRLHKFGIASPLLCHTVFTHNPEFVAGKELGRRLWLVFPRRKETHRLHPGVQEVQSTGGEEVHLREEPAGWGSHAGEGGAVN